MTAGDTASRESRPKAVPVVDLSRQQVFDHLEDLKERGVLSREQDDTDGRRVVWRDDGVHRLGDHGDAELEPVDLEDLAGF